MRRFRSPFGELHHDDIPLWCEYRPERVYSVSTVCFPSGNAKVLASELALIAAMVTAAVAVA